MYLHLNTDLEPLHFESQEEINFFSSRNRKLGQFLSR